MEKNEGTFNVFYSTGKDSYFQSKTDCPNFDILHDFINSELFKVHGFRLDFVLKDGVELIIGEPKDATKEYFKNAMLFAIDIPLEEYLK